VAADSRPFSQRDREVLEALAQQRVAVLAQVAHWLGVTEATAGRRVAALHDAGLVERQRLFAGQSAAVRITEAGLKRINSPLGKPGRKLDEHRHDVGVGWVWTAAREGAFGELAEIVSERSMRSHDARLDRMPRGERFLEDNPATYAVGVGSMSTTGRLERHYPDLLLKSRAGRTVAVELELTSKGRRRLDKVMSAYAGDPRIDAVLYLVPDAALATKIREAAARAGIERSVHVRQVALGGVAGVDHSLARQPGRARDLDRAAELSRGGQPKRARELSRGGQPSRALQLSRGGQPNRALQLSRVGTPRVEPDRGVER
jgi:DNA-binding MarR family transcriptional regulator